MSVVQQRQSLQTVIGPPLALAGLTTVAIIATVAGTIFGIASLSFWQVGMACYLQDRIVTTLTALSLSATITAIALSILFPPTMIAVIPAACFLSAFSCTYSLIQVLRRNFN